MPVPLPLEGRLRRCLTAHPDWPDERVAAAIVGSTRAMVRRLGEEV
jgi:hypothetical protein